MVIALIGGSGGVGASTCAAALAEAAAGVLIDLDPVGPGLDVLLGMERVAGARWSGVRVGGGFLDPQVLAAGLPYWGVVPVLALDSGPPDAQAAAQVITAATELGPVVVDLGRGAGVMASELGSVCDLVLVLARAATTDLASAYAVVAAVPGRSGLLVRPGPVALRAAAEAVGVPLVARWPSVRRPLRMRGQRPAGVHRALRRRADEVIDGIERGLWSPPVTAVASA